MTRQDDHAEGYADPSPHEKIMMNGAYQRGFRAGREYERNAQPAKGAGDALAMALADNGIVDSHSTEQYQVVETLPILAALASRGYVVVRRDEPV